MKEAKYLGHFIKADGKDDKDIHKACGKSYAQGNSLIRKFHMCTDKVKIKAICHFLLTVLLCPSVVFQQM